MMHPAYISLLVGIAVLLCLLILFRIETRRGARFLGGIRESMDRGVERGYTSLGASFNVFEQDILRQSAHYIFHLVLKVVLGVIRFLERSVHRLLHTNREVAQKTVRERTARTKLDHIVEHKAAVALSDAEKRAYKERSIGTYLS